jgi:polyferredoxin
LVRIAHSAPDKYRESSINKKQEQASYLHPKRYAFASFFFFLAGAVLIGRGWWNANYGEGAVWKGMALVGAGGIIVIASVLMFGLYCCQNAK